MYVRRIFLEDKRLDSTLEPPQEYVTNANIIYQDALRQSHVDAKLGCTCPWDMFYVSSLCPWCPVFGSMYDASSSTYLGIGRGTKRHKIKKTSYQYCLFGIKIVFQLCIVICVSNGMFLKD